MLRCALHLLASICLSLVMVLLATVDPKIFHQPLEGKDEVFQRSARFPKRTQFAEIGVRMRTVQPVAMPPLF